MTNKRPHRNSADEMLTVKEIAELDGCSEKTVRRAIKAGLLEVHHMGPVGAILRISPDAHESYRRACRSRRF